MPTLSSFQIQLLVAVYEQQRRYYSGDWAFDSTIHSKVSFVLARSHNQLRRSPAAGQWNMSRAFEQRFNRAVTQLVKDGYCDWQSIRTPDAPARFAAGYKRHRARDRDLFLTDHGLDRAEEALRHQGRMATEMSTCDDTPEPQGPTPSGLAGCDD